MSYQYEKAIEEFQKADLAYQQMQEHLMSGGLAVELAAAWSEGDDYLREQWQLYLKRLQTALEERNARLTDAKHAIRAAVQQAPTQWRGPEGRASNVRFGGFECSSVTRRSFDAKTLVSLVEKHGLLERLLTLKKRDKDGQEYPLVEEKVVVNDYEGVLDWLQAHQLDDVINGAYDENEGTPQVKGPKPLSFLGEQKKE